jgi:nickel superoxide dismutase
MRSARRWALVAAVAVALGGASQALAHCQIPCGIYGDELRLELIAEHIGTVGKSMQQIVELGKATPINYNQLVRWVGNKEDHAQKIQDVVTEYFLAQRIKVPAESEGEAYKTYLRHLELLHRMQVTAMKAKQTTDLKHVETLRGLLAKFRASYLGDAG